MFTFSVTAQDCPGSCSVYVPNVMTPDCEGVDCELLTISSECTILSYEFKVFNRWGNLMFESDDPENRFDCTDVAEATYMWMLQVTFCNHEEASYNGHITVVK